MNAIAKFLSDQRGEIADRIIGLVIAVSVVAGVIGVAITSITGTDTSGWDASAVTLWGILSLVVVASVVMMIYRSTKGE